MESLLLLIFPIVLIISVIVYAIISPSIIPKLTFVFLGVFIPSFIFYWNFTEEFLKFQGFMILFLYFLVAIAVVATLGSLSYFLIKRANK